MNKAPRRTFRIVLALTVLGVVGLWIIAVNNGRQRLDLTFVNSTGGPLTDVTFGDAPAIAKVAEGETVKLSLPLTESVSLRLRDRDGRLRMAGYEFSPLSGLTHSLKVELTPAVAEGQPTHGRLTQFDSTPLLFGAKVKTKESIGELQIDESDTPRQK